MIYVQDNDPVLISYRNELVSTLSTVELLSSTDQVLTVIQNPISSELEDGITEWYAIFDPHYFQADQIYKINWIGTNVNGSAYTEQETGIEVKISNDFYSTFTSSLRRSIFDDAQAADYPIPTILEAIKYATSLVNLYPPYSSMDVYSIPYNLLLDFSKIYLYRGKAAREAMETFQYNDIGKSFNLDRSGRLLALAQDLARSAEQQLAIFKKNLRPVLMGLASRYTRRTGSSARSVITQRIIFRNFTR